MNQQLLDELRRISPEEEGILAGKGPDSDIYTSRKADMVDAAKLLERGRLITVRPSTRFAYFPPHRHNYIEMVYMCQGLSHHVVDGDDILLKEGELLLLSLKARQELFPAGEEDIAVNFIVLPQFFDEGLRMLGETESPLRNFLVNALQGRSEVSYLHFRVADILPIQNLLENLIWSLWKHEANQRAINQAAMGLLFLNLVNYSDRIRFEPGKRRASLQLEILNYIEDHYVDGDLADLAEELGYDFFWLSRKIKQLTGRNYTQLVQTKRLQQAAYLLTQTSMRVDEIGLKVGYENRSYFYRLFKKEMGETPRAYRLSHRIGIAPTGSP